MENKNEKQSFHLSYRDVARLIVLAGIVTFAVINLGSSIKVLTNVLGIITPVIIGIFLAFVLNFPLSLIERKLLNGDSHFMQKIRRPVALLISLLLLFGVMALIVILVIPQSINAFQEISGQIPAYYQQLIDWTEKNMTNLPWLKDYILKFD